MGYLATLLLALVFLSSCLNAELEKQAEQIRQQEGEIARQRKELDALLAGQTVKDQKLQDCNRAFRDYFENAKATRDSERAITLYRDGLALCPDDDIAHFELGKALADRGRYAEAEKEFEAALKINPDFVDAKRQLDNIRRNR